MKILTNCKGSYTTFKLGEVTRSWANISFKKKTKDMNLIKRLCAYRCAQRFF